MTEATRLKFLSTVDKAGFFFFIVLVFFLPIANAVIESSFGFIFLCFLIKTALIRPGLKELKNFFKDRINLSLLVFYIALLLSLFAAGPLWQKSLKAWFFKWGEGVLLFYFAQGFLNRKRITVLLWVLLASSLLVSIDGIYQWVNGVDFLRGFECTNVDNAYTVVRATFNHYNNFATFLAVILFINLAFLIRSKNIWLSFALSVLFMLAAANLILTGSRGALLAMSAGALVFLFFLPNKRFGCFLILSAFSLIAVYISFPQGAKIAYSLIARADAGRFVIWKAAFSMFKESPVIGKGLGLFMKLLPSYGLEALYAHNCYLQMLAEAGLLGLLTFLWFLGEVGSRIVAYLQRNRDIVLLGLFCAFLAYLVNAFFDTQLYALKLSLLFWILAGFLTRYPERKV